MSSPPAVRWLRLEGAGLLLLALVGWHQFAEAPPAWVFAATFLLPDLAMLGYLAGPRRGAMAYNLAHTSSIPAILLATGALRSHASFIAVALVWLGHIGFDRMLGYGLKTSTEFRVTHLGTIGRQRT